MQTNGDRLEKMMEYGLTEYEARTYLALLHLGVASAREEDKKLLMSAFASKDAPSSDKAGSFQVLKGRKNVLNRKYEMVGRALSEVLEMGTEFSAVRMGYYLPLLKDRARSGVKL